MADHDTDIPEMDYPAHNAMYESFISWTKYSIIALVILLAAMAAFL